LAERLDMKGDVPVCRKGVKGEVAGRPVFAFTDPGKRPPRKPGKNGSREGSPVQRKLHDG